MRKELSACAVALALLLVALPVGGVEAATPMPTPSPAAPTPAATPAPSPPGVDPLEQRIQQKLAEQAALDATKQSLAIEVTAAHGQQSALTTVIAANQEAIQQTLTLLTAAEKRFSDASVQQATQHAAAVVARQHEREDKVTLGRYMRQRYISQDGFASYVLSSSSVSQMFSRAADLNHLVDRGQVLLLMVKQDIKEADAAEAAARKAADTAQLAAAQLATQELQLRAQTDKAQTLIDQLSAQAQAATAEIAMANRQTLAVAQDIAATRIAQLDATISAAEQADWQAATYWIQQHIGSLPGDFQTPPVEGVAHFVWPAPGTDMVQRFGPSPYPFEPAFGGYPHFHTGIDLTRGAGSPILAADDGIVVVAGFSSVGYGNHIIVAHTGGFLTLYGHLETMLVHAGDRVVQGQLIGLMGTTGNSTGPHLHFEVRFNNGPVDPIPFLPPLPPGASGPPPLPGQ